MTGVDSAMKSSSVRRLVELLMAGCLPNFRPEDVARKFDAPEFNLELESELLNSGATG